jgi:hypothetical protein
MFFPFIVFLADLPVQDCGNLPTDWRNPEGSGIRTARVRTRGGFCLLDLSILNFSIIRGSADAEAAARQARTNVRGRGQGEGGGHRPHLIFYRLVAGTAFSVLVVVHCIDERSLLF